MEYKLNKIDPDVRRQVNEVTKEGKVHGADHNLSVNKNKDNNRGNSYLHDESENKKKIVVDAVMKESIDIEVFSVEDNRDVKIKGRLLDIRR